MPATIRGVVGRLRLQYYILKDPRFAAWYSGRIIQKDFHVPTRPSDIRFPIHHPQTGEPIKDCIQYAVVGVLQAVEQADERGNSGDHIRLWLLTEHWSSMVEAFKGNFDYAPQYDGQETAQLMFDGNMAEAWKLALDDRNAP